MPTSNLTDMLDVVNVKGETFTTKQAEAYRTLRGQIMRDAYTAALTDLLNYRDHFSDSERGFKLLHDHLAARIDSQ